MLGLTDLNRELCEVTDLAYHKKLDEYEYGLFKNDIERTIGLLKGDVTGTPVGRFTEF